MNATDQAYVEDAPLKASDAAPEWLKDRDDRKKWGRQFSEMAKASEEAVGMLDARWREVDDAAVNRPRESMKRPWPTAPWYHFPVVRPKLQQGESFVANPLTKSDPYVIVRAGGPAGGRCDAVERSLQLHLARGQYARMIRLAMDVTQRRGKSVLRATYKPFSVKGGRNVYPGVEFDLFSPEHVRQYPSYANSPEASLLFGHVYDTSVLDIQALQETGYYFEDVKAVGTKSQEEWEAALLQEKRDNSVRPTHEAVEMGEFFVKFDDDEEQDWYQIQLDLRGENILRCVKYRYRTPWYKDLFIHQEYRRWLFENSRGSDVLGPQYYSNDMRNITTWITLWNGMQSVFMQGSLPDGMVEGRPGMVYPIPWGSQVFSPQGRTDLGALPALIQLGQNDADFASGFAPQAGGMYKATRPTATEVNKVSEGQNAGINDDVANMAFGIADMSEFLVGDLLFEHFEDWYPHFRGVLPNISQADFDRPYWYEANAVSSAAPEQIFQQVSLMVGQLAQLIRVMPDLPMRFPELVPGLLKSALDATNIAQRDTMIPAEQDGQLQDSLMGGISPAIEQPGIGMGAEGLPAPAPELNGALTGM